MPGHAVHRPEWSGNPQPENASTARRTTAATARLTDFQQTSHHPPASFPWEPFTQLTGTRCLLHGVYSIDDWGAAIPKKNCNKATHYSKILFEACYPAPRALPGTHRSRRCRSRSRTRPPKATAQGVAKTISTMAKGQFQVALDCADTDPKSRRNLVRRLPLDRNAAKHFAGPRRQFCQRSLECLYLRTQLYDPRRIGSIIANIQKHIDLRRTHAIVLSL